MAEMDRSKRYKDSPKAKHGKMQDKAESKAEGEVKSAEKKEGEGKGPTDKSAAEPGGVGKVGEDKGPEGSPSPEFGIIFDRQRAESSAMAKRHAEVHEMHGKEMKDMVGRHHKEVADMMEGKATAQAESSAGSPPKLGKTESEGTKGSNV